MFRGAFCRPAAEMRLPRPPAFPTWTAWRMAASTPAFVTVRSWAVGPRLFHFLGYSAGV